MRIGIYDTIERSLHTSITIRRLNVIWLRNGCNRKSAQCRWKGNALKKTVDSGKRAQIFKFFMSFLCVCLFVLHSFYHLAPTTLSQRFLCLCFLLFQRLTDIKWKWASVKRNMSLVLFSVYFGIGRHWWNCAFDIHFNSSITMTLFSLFFNELKHE